MSHLKRLYLLPKAEIDNLYARPTFNTDEQEIYFTMNQEELNALAQYTNTKTRVFFVLQLGYFKAKYQFFNFTFEDARSDVDYILSNFFNKRELILSGRISRGYISDQKQAILQLFDYKDWSEEQKIFIETHLGELLKYYPKVHDALRQLLVYIESQRIVAPSYRSLQDMFTQAYANENNRLSQKILLIPAPKQTQLSALIQRNDGITKLNVIRADQKDFQYTACKEEVEKAFEIIELYEFSKQFIPTLALSKNAVRYYADLAEQYAASRLRRLSQEQQWLQALCFIHHRYQQIMDNLITSFMYHTKTILDEGKTYGDKALLDYRASLITDFPKLSKFLKWFPKRNPNLTHEELNRAAYKILPEKQFPALAEFLDDHLFDKEAAEWEFYLKSHRKFSLYLRPVLLNVPFVFHEGDHDIMPLIQALKDHYAKGKMPASFKLSDELLQTIPKKMLPYLKRDLEDEHLDPHLFEFFIYRKMYNHLDKGRLCCNESVSYCDMDHDLINEDLVDKVEEIAAEFGYTNIPIFCDQHLDEAVNELDETWVNTIDRINSGENKGFELIDTEDNETPDWHLNYDASDKLDDTFFKTLPKTGIADIMMFMGDLMNMWSVFSHMKTRYNKKKTPAKLALNAGILADAFGVSAEQMADMSDINYNLLRSTQEDFIRIDTLCPANDIACNFIYSLPIFKGWNLMGNKVLGDLDGQKQPTSRSTIQSRYSTKYLGKDPGLSIYSLTANNTTVNAKNIGLNEYEGHSAYDLIYGNKTDIEINMVTGDNHSLNKTNFVILNAINVQFVPSIKNVREAANSLYAVKPIENNTAIIHPKGFIDIDHIRSEKRGILRILLSLLMQENTQTTLVRKLNTHAGYSSLKKALFDYNEILRSTHILNLIDNMELRKAIRTARNRTEAYHQLQGGLRKIYRGIFKGKKIRSNRISAHAIRLVSNCIIAYNSLILNNVYEKMMTESVSQEVLDNFLRISPIAWIHILFTGQYNFKKSNGDIDLDAMIRAIEKHLKKHFWKGG